MGKLISKLERDSKQTYWFCEAKGVFTVTKCDECEVKENCPWCMPNSTCKYEEDELQIGRC